MVGFADFLIERVGEEHVWLLDKGRDLYNGEFDWKVNKQGYYWVDENGRHYAYQGEPVGHHNHHTASSGYTPFVRNASGKTKANAWAGLRRGTRLYQFDGGVPTIALASAGPANYSAGAGNKEFLAYCATDRRFHGPQRNADDAGFYGNRHYWATEVIALGDGSPLADDMWDLLIEYNRALRDYLEWSTWRLGGHYDHTRRKIDLKVAQGNPYSVGLLQDLIENTQPTTPPPPPPAGEHTMNTIQYGDGFRASREKQPTVKAAQIMLAAAGFADSNTQDNTCAADGLFGRGTEAAVKAFQGSKNLPQSGVVDADTWDALEGW